ncbi:hypothetical protein JXA32_03030 [Candidatus Sumerlaeota bacterium]|nr:hypothetical protein [Candidatus Sumerlaeota bacterium]
MSKDNRRRQFIINPRAQWTYVLRIIALEISVAIVATLLTATTTVLSLQSDTGGMIQPYGYWHNLIASSVFLCLILAAGLIFIGIRISHQIFGPAYHIQRVFLEALANQEIPSKIHLREHDEFHDVAQTINAWIDAQKDNRQ